MIARKYPKSHRKFWLSNPRVKKGDPTSKIPPSNYCNNFSSTHHLNAVSVKTWSYMNMSGRDPEKEWKNVALSFLPGTGYLMLLNC